MLQNTTFIKITVSRTKAMPAQKPILTPKRDVVPNRLVQIAVQFI